MKSAGRSGCGTDPSAILIAPRDVSLTMHRQTTTALLSFCLDYNQLHRAIPASNPPRRQYKTQHQELLESTVTADGHKHEERVADCSVRLIRS